MSLHTLLTKHQIVHGIENDQPHIDAFVKELTQVMAGVVPGKQLIELNDDMEPFKHGSNQAISEMQSAIKLMGEK